MASIPTESRKIAPVPSTVEQPIFRTPPGRRATGDTVQIVSQTVSVPGTHPTARERLYIAARAPRPGFTKTRLGRAIGYEQAAFLYAAFLQDLAARFSTAPFEIGWYVTPERAWSELRPLVGQLPSRWPVPVLDQGEGDWTDRQRTLFRGAAIRGERCTVLIASDSPHLDAQVVVEAFVRLTSDDLVLGPTHDGGYYLIGMRGTPCPGQAAPWDALAGVRMGTGTVLDEIVTRAHSLGLAISTLPATFDVDEVSDLDRLVPLALTRADLAATRQALGRLGLLGRPLPVAEPHYATAGGRR
jgi:rSAM/selenodomain-associated transferase 1